MPVTLLCQNCAQPFQVEPSRQDTARFCSNACKRVARRNSLTLICEVCQQPFTVKAYRKDTAQFCSRACKRQAMLIAPEYDTCTECGERFLVSRGQRSNTGDRFCSRKCATVYTGRNKHGQALRTFWSRVQLCEHGWECVFCCWPFQGTLDLNGYGKIMVAGKQTYAHRAAWELGNGQTLPDDAEAAHWCHFKACANFMHLHRATHKENMHDSIRDRRHAFGERNGHAKLTEETALQALALRVEGWSFRKIAAHFSIAHRSIESLCYGRTWKHLPRPAILPKNKPPGRRRLAS